LSIATLRLVNDEKGFIAARRDAILERTALAQMAGARDFPFILLINNKK
jgi:hypothetical protein